MIRNIATITNPGLEKDVLVIYTDANNVTPFAPEWLFSTGLTGSRDFNGTTDKIVWDSVHDLTGHPITVSAWVYLDTYTAHSHAILMGQNLANNNYASPYFLIGTDGVLWLYRGGTTPLYHGSNSAMGTGAWVHVLATHDGTMTDYTKIKLYKNGIDDTPQFNGGNGAGEYASTGKWAVGNRDYDNARGFDGHIAQVGLWDRVLTQQEITRLASGVKPNAFLSNLLFYFSGETSSLNANPPNADGTATGTTWSSVGPSLDPITMTADLGDGTWLYNTIAISKTYTAGKGRHKVRLTCPNWSRLTELNLVASAGALQLPIRQIERCHNLQRFSLTNVNFIGQFPYFGNCKSMLSIGAMLTPFTGMFPTLDPCTQITSLLVHSNKGSDKSGFYGSIPNIQFMSSLNSFDFSGNRYTGSCPSFAFAGSNLVVVEFGTNSLSGTLPSFSSNPNITLFSGGYNNFTGTLPDFSNCTKMTVFEMNGCGFTGYTAGSFATQKDLTELQLAGSSLPSAAVNNILADCVTSLGISGRVSCLVELQGGSNGAPTGQGITDKATLITAGWTVTTN